MRKVFKALGLSSWQALVFSHRAQGFTFGVLAVLVVVSLKSCGGA